MATQQSKSFSDVTLSAFPAAAVQIARMAEKEVSNWVLQTHRTPATRVEINGSPAFIPYRIHFSNLHGHAVVDTVSSAAVCLLSRSTDGYIRQQALRRILMSQENWVVPYIVLLLGDYVVEIGNEINDELHNLNRMIYIDFIRENRSTMRSIRSRAVSYWNCYYRHKYPQMKNYPPLAAFRELEAWAA